MNERAEKVQLPMRVHAKVRDRIRRQAEGERRTINAVLEAAVLEYLCRHEVIK